MSTLENLRKSARRAGSIFGGPSMMADAAGPPHPMPISTTL